MLVLGIRMELRNDLHRVVMLSLGYIHFPIGGAQFRGEKITLCRSDLWMVSLHLDLVVNTWGDISSRRIRLS